MILQVIEENKISKEDVNNVYEKIMVMINEHEDED